MDYRVAAQYVVVSLVGTLILMSIVAYGVADDTDDTDTGSVEYDPEITVSVNGEGDVTTVETDRGGSGGEINRSAVAAAAVAAINDARTDRGREALQREQALRQRARVWSVDMASAGTLSHDTPACRPGGENVAMTFWQTPVETGDGVETYRTESELGNAIAEQWLTSDGHRENIMDTSYSRTGIGIAKSGDEIYATQRLCG